MPLSDSWTDLLTFIALCFPLTWLALSGRLESLAILTVGKCADLGYVLWNISDVAAFLKKPISLRTA